MASVADIERVVEGRLRDALPEVDLLEVSLVGNGTLRLIIDHPAGVSHDLCAEVTSALDPTGLREDFGVEVWSPGPERPLRTPEHFTRFTGRRVRLRIAEVDGGKAHSLTGTVGSVTSAHVIVLHREGPVEVPLAHIRKARLLPEESA